MDGFPELLRLSRLDATLAERRESQRGIEPRRSACVERRAAVAAELEQGRVAVTDAEQEQRRHESTAADQQAILAKLESQQHQVKSNEAYTALLAEMEHAREAISEAETLELEAMEGVEAAKATLADAEAKQAETLQAIEAEEQACDKQESALGAQIEALESERASLLGGLDRELAVRYEKVASRRIPAVVVVSRETCEGCRVDIPAQSFIEMLKGESVFACGTCQRLLIHQDHAGGESA